MKKNYDEHNFSVTHTVGLVTSLPILWRSGKHMFFLIFRKFFAEIICQTINFSNFGLGEHSGNGLNVIIGDYKFKQIIAILLIFNELFFNPYIELTLKLYEFTNSKGEKVYIREDKPVKYHDGGSQPPHFNAGNRNDRKLKQHHYYGN